MIVIDCADPLANLTAENQEYANGSVPSNTVYLASAVIKCLIGFKWTDGSLEKQMACDANGMWTPIPFCMSIFLLYP